ncbi:hypothetical protein CCACVL1_25431 [Corchorus capsularis]|uniref:Uncharacterized protein n=1 Tax=Corchorus capsularis TaxID=210143 RepID=A0A1R3GKH3_COCAP|nr:hypothetical protein CCACVL1_25431 [Corchorus capsularis]
MFVGSDNNNVCHNLLDGIGDDNHLQVLGCKLINRTGPSVFGPLKIKPNINSPLLHRRNKGENPYIFGIKQFSTPGGTLGMFLQIMPPKTRHSDNEEEDNSTSNVNVNENVRVDDRLTHEDGVTPAMLSKAMMELISQLQKTRMSTDKNAKQVSLLVQSQNAMIEQKGQNHAILTNAINNLSKHVISMTTLNTGAIPEGLRVSNFVNGSSQNNMTRVSNSRHPPRIIIRETGTCSNPISGNVMDNNNGKSGRLSPDHNVLPQMDKFAPSRVRPFEEIGDNVRITANGHFNQNKSTVEAWGQTQPRNDVNGYSNYDQVQNPVRRDNDFQNLLRDQVLGILQEQLVPVRRNRQRPVYRSHIRIGLINVIHFQEEKVHVSKVRSGLVLELRKKFEDREFIDLAQLASCVSKCERLLEEDDDKRRVPRATYYTQNEVNVGLDYYSDDDVDVNVVELSLSKPHDAIKAGKLKFPNGDKAMMID